MIVGWNGYCACEKLPLKENSEVPSNHWLKPLLEPRSAVIIGASATEGSLGRSAVDHMVERGYGGRLYAVNSKYAKIGNVDCFSAISELPETPDLAVIAVNQKLLEQVLSECVTLGVRAAVIFADCGNQEQRDRLARIAAEARMPICGGNGMGFQNFTNSTHATFSSCPVTKAAPGNVSLIAHSGSVIQALATDLTRLRYNLTVSSGQEINTTLADYLDYALELPSTKAVALFIETIRDSARFVEALQKAVSKRIPIVALKVGRTAKSAAMAISHSGAVVGNASTYEALFDRYNVISVKTLDDLAATAQLLAHVKDADPGGLCVAMDSGGLRELMVDIAEDKGVTFTELSKSTLAQLQDQLNDGMIAENPLDAWGSRTDAKAHFARCLELMMRDPSSAFGAIATEAGDAFQFGSVYAEIVAETQRLTGKPMFMMSSFSGVANSKIARQLLDCDVPLINGIDCAMTAVKAVGTFNARIENAAREVRLSVPQSALENAKALLALPGSDGEKIGLSVLQAFEIPVVANYECDNLKEVLAAIDRTGFPVVLKTAMPGIHHKSDVGGVLLNLDSVTRVTEAYKDFTQRLGPKVMVQRMSPSGVEMSFGMVVDPQFGALVTVSPGGKWIELFADRQIALAPFDEQRALELIDRLKIRPLFDGRRGEKPYDVHALAQAFSKFSIMAAALKDELAEFDVNPVIITDAEVIAVDALPVGAATKYQDPKH
ncbi:MAG: CoA-binding protein [Mesorhizobium sp.]|nr:MAG: CoA-binding protein [Mesorhizobium sp.]